MRTLALAAISMVTVLGASGADAQRLGGYPGASYPVPGYPGQAMAQPLPPVATQPARTGSRWGGTVGGRWYGGVNAPGGWNAYRRPTRGYRLSNYWLGGSFFIGDFAGYGLSAPPQGYRWYRYYDDAVLVDDRGQVYDSVGGLDWDGGGYGGGAGGYASDGYAYAQGGSGGAGGSGGGYSQRYQQSHAQPLPLVTRGGGVTTYSTSSEYASQDGDSDGNGNGNGQGGGAPGGYPQPRGGYTSGGYYYPPETTTIVTVHSAPTITTTTEYVEETTATRSRYRTRYVTPRRVVYRPAPRRVYRPARTCGCTSVVRTRVIHVPVRARARAVEEVVQGS